MTGYDKMLENLKREKCPDDVDLDDINRGKCRELRLTNKVIPQELCDNCWDKALEKEYDK